MVETNKISKIYCIGDSHVNVFSGHDVMQKEWPAKHTDLIPLLSSYRLGAHLAYSLHKKDSEARKKLFSSIKKIPKGSYILLCYGEIDCRVHLLKQSIKQNIKLKLVVDDCVDKYFSVIKEVDKLGYRVLVWGVIPSTKFKIEYQEFPTYGTNFQRNKVTGLFNERLKMNCDRYQMPFLDITNFLLNADGTTNMNMYSDPIHISSKTIPYILSEICSKVPNIDKLKQCNYKRNYLEFVWYSIFRKYINYFYINMRNLFIYSLYE
jgi:hypothetical protein